MLEKILFELAKRTSVVKTLSSNKPNWITKVDENGIYVETEVSRQKHQNGEKTNPWDVISFDFITTAWQEFVSQRTANANDFVKTRGRTSFLMAFFAELPFVEVVTKDQSAAIQLKEFKTDDLPSEQFHKVVKFLEEIIEGTYDPIKLSTQLRENKNLYSIKTRGRQDLRLLGFLDDRHEKNDVAFHMYAMSEEHEKVQVLRNIIEHTPYFRIALYVLELLKDFAPREKKEALLELGMLIVRNSKADNLMVESVAKERTTNLLKWLESVHLVDENWVPIENSREITAVNSKLQQYFLHIMNKYLKAKTEPFGEHPLGSVMRQDLTSEIRNLHFINEDYVVSGSVGMGNWAAVPWLAIMHRSITTSTQRGYYLVYLFSEDMTSLYLTFAQGITETPKEEIIQIKEEIRNRIEMKESVHKDDQIYLGPSKKAKDYAFSTAAYIRYDIPAMPDEKELVQDLQDMIGYYEKYIELKSQYPDTSPAFEVNEEQETILPMQDVVNHIYSYITSKGFYYEKEEVTNLFLALKTKPFVIISGISGTGKTKIVQWLAESVGATERNGQFTLIPVRPDWSDGSDLLGYVDISGVFKEGPLTRIVESAISNPNRPYFALLDEMNLARVEHYFSDILSVMESRKRENGQLVSSPLLSRELTGRDIYLPSNLYIIGTVNMDETTHPFSKKVLDRANTIEFNRVKLDHFQFLMNNEPVDPVNLHNDVFTATFLHLQDVFNQNQEVVEKATEVLVEINDVLQLLSAHVGYRVRDEICFYLAHSREGKLMTDEQALDYCILQKILPRIAGSDTRVERVLKELYKIFTNKRIENINTITQENLGSAKYPKSAEKVVEMLRRLDDDGFTSFWLSS